MLGGKNIQAAPNLHDNVLREKGEYYAFPLYQYTQQLVGVQEVCQKK